MKNDDEKIKNTMLEIETLRKEYDIVSKQYQEGMKTYINDISENEEKNKCSKYKKNDTNVSQLCYDKIWHEQGCLTDTPQIDATKTLDQLVQYSYKTSISKNPSDIEQCYGNSSVVPMNNIIKNGLFSNPVLQNNTFKYISSDTEVPSWNFNGGALINNSTAWGYEIPYPNGNQAVSIQLTASISQDVELKKNIKYNLKLFCSGRNCCNGVNTIKVELYNSSGQMVLSILEIVPTLVWSEYTANFTSPDTETYKLTFSGLGNSGDKSSAIQNIELIENKSAIYPNILDYISLKGKTWWGTSEVTGSSKMTDTVDECIALCESDANCSGATFNPTRSCWIRQGESEITPGLMDDPNYSSDYAIVKKLKYDMLSLKSLNSKLLTLNETIIDKIKLINPKIETYKNKEQINFKKIEDYHKVLLKHKNKISEKLNDYQDIESQYDNSSIYVKQQHWTYNIYVLLALIIIFITIKKLSEGDNTAFVFIMIGIIFAFYIFIVKLYNKK